MRLRLSDHILIPEHLRMLLKRPLGKLVQGGPESTRPEVEKIVRSKEGKLVAVGDAVTRELLAMGVVPDVCIVDGKIERKPVEHIVVKGAKELKCENRPGTISGEAYRAVVMSLGLEGPVVLRVEGEEDLLGLIVMAEAALGTLMLYGQPGEGVVVVNVDEKARGFARRLIEAAAQL